MKYTLKKSVSTSMGSFVELRHYTFSNFNKALRYGLKEYVENSYWSYIVIEDETSVVFDGKFLIEKDRTSHYRKDIMESLLRYQTLFEKHIDMAIEKFGIRFVANWMHRDGRFLEYLYNKYKR